MADTEAESYIVTLPMNGINDRAGPLNNLDVNIYIDTNDMSNVNYRWLTGYYDLHVIRSILLLYKTDLISGLRTKHNIQLV